MTDNKYQITDIRMEFPTLGRYRHYKGKEYEVLGVVLHTETREPMVLYKALYPVTDLDPGYGEVPLFVRPLQMWNETVEGKSRFEFIAECQQCQQPNSANN